MAKFGVKKPKGHRWLKKVERNCYKTKLMYYTIKSISCK